MARILLWLFVIIGFIKVTVNDFKGDSTDIFIKILIFLSLTVLAICEAITEEGD